MHEYIGLQVNQVGAHGVPPPPPPHTHTHTPTPTPTHTHTHMYTLTHAHSPAATPPHGACGDLVGTGGENTRSALAEGKVSDCTGIAQLSLHSYCCLPLAVLRSTTATSLCPSPTIACSITSGPLIHGSWASARGEVCMCDFIS